MDELDKQQIRKAREQDIKNEPSINLDKSNKDKEILQNAVITKLQAHKALTKASLWFFVLVLSIIFGILAIINGINIIEKISGDFNNGNNTKGVSHIFLSIGKFMEAGLYLFFIIYSLSKGMLTIGVFISWRKQTLPLRLKEKEIKIENERLYQEVREEKIKKLDDKKSKKNEDTKAKNESKESKKNEDTKVN